MAKLLDYPIANLIGRCTAYLLGRGFSLDNINVPNGRLSKFSPTCALILKFLFRHKKFFKTFFLKTAIESNHIPAIYHPILFHLNAQSVSEFQAHLSHLHSLSITLTDSVLATTSVSQNTMNDSGVSRGAPGVLASTQIEGPPMAIGSIAMSELREEEVIMHYV